MIDLPDESGSFSVEFRPATRYRIKRGTTETIGTAVSKDGISRAKFSSISVAEITRAGVALRERKVRRNISDASPLSPGPGILIAFSTMACSVLADPFLGRYITNSHER